MVIRKELISRIKSQFSFNKQELIGISASILIVSFIFSFRDWGEETFNLLLGLSNFVTVLIVAAITFFLRLSFQKIYGLSKGHKPVFNVWWAGLLISLFVAFLSNGYIPLIFAGTMVSAFVVKQRLGEFRYGQSYNVMGIIAFIGIIANLTLATLGSVGLYFIPGSYFFQKMIILNLVMAFCSLLPLPWLGGMAIFFGSRVLYVTTIAITFLVSALLITRTRIGLIMVIFLGTLVAIINSLISSDK
tara:strand:- start:862 stop:1599 length:738 start_codon:yes stop_codon:yes gene_type:complete